MKRLFLCALAFLAASSVVAQNDLPKREFRGVWIPTVGDKYYAQHSTAENKAYLINMLDSAQRTGCNAIIFHCRPQGDAFYPSTIEEWSFWIAGEAGKAPAEMWDPMEFMVEESHKRGMELHAWINPYRVGYDHQIAPNALARRHPEWFVQYGGQTYFDPAYPECRDHINRVVADIVTRYDIDGLHMDDFFYPYPVGDEAFPDTASYAKLGKGRDLGDWRRENVDLLIESMHNTMHAIKPWVRFGISPFGIWRNKKTDPDGSETNGFQCYDGQYADCPKWTREGWVDYMVPQLYWQMEHKLASDSILMDWWNEHTYGRDMYYGYAIRNTMDYANTRQPEISTQLSQKLSKQRSLRNVQGHVWWPCYSLNANYKGFADSLATQQQASLALPPRYHWLDEVAPPKVRNLKIKKEAQTQWLCWDAPATTQPMQKAGFYVVYRFAANEQPNLERASAIVAITYDRQFNVTGQTGTYVVTALDRCNNESEGVMIKKDYR